MDELTAILNVGGVGLHIGADHPSVILKVPLHPVVLQPQQFGVDVAVWIIGNCRFYYISETQHQYKEPRTEFLD